MSLQPKRKETDNPVAAHTAPKADPKVDPKATPSPKAASPLTVTVANPTPPTNYSYDSHGTPPTPPGLPFVDDGAAGPLTAIAAPTAGPAAEAAGTVVVDTKPGATSITVMGNYTTTPNASHPSSQAPGTLPVITGLVPATTAGTGGTMTLTVNGTGFEEQSVVNVGGVPMTTAFISATQLQAENAPKRTTPGTTPVTVVTGGTASAPVNWTFT